jgi:Glycosyltransferase Family 4
MTTKNSNDECQVLKGKRVLLFIGALSMGGAERQFVALAKGLKQRGVKVQVLLNYEGGDFLPELQTAGIQYTVLHLGTAWSFPWYLLRAISALRRIRPDVVYGGNAVQFHDARV